ncbi:MAG: tRNA dihydrouridine(20/20a) synthase DusA [Gammaproteobacteria bacterium]|nr:tRNA dihydrouridine(20/20a) synthase DusA [Gammaproteobacteria bacterium]NNJ71978.1 tRNA dihydrouridine(20/20a) synthase DusA [Enterobacterales bacterium]
MTPLPVNRCFSVAPMLDWTDRHCRYFMRLLSRHALLYTEMITTGALIHGPREDLLKFDPKEQPVAIQLGGSNPQDLAVCAKMAEDCGYAEVNLNVGCPSDRVQSGRFGACLMAEPQLVAECIAAMLDAVDIPVTIKSRIGIDRSDTLDELGRFVEIVKSSGCQTFIIHARKAWLDGLSPKENRDVPPLNYDRVYAIKQQFPDLEIIINGGIKSLSDCQQHLTHVDGVMVGREVYQNPWLLSQIDELLFDEPASLFSREDIVRSLYPYIEKHLSSGGRLNHISRHIIGLFQAMPGAKLWRRYISENAHLENAGTEVLEDALALVAEQVAKIDAVSENH